MAIYKLNQHSSMSEPHSVTLDLDDGSGKVLVIPFDPDNTDYQEYQAWVAEGNTPAPV